MINRSFYSADIKQFKEEPMESILATMVLNNPYELNDLQRDAWIIEIESLKQQLTTIDSGRIILEYTIPRMGKRVDIVLLLNGIVFLLEFKAGDKKLEKHALDQVLDYALDLKNFQKESHSIIYLTNAYRVLLTRARQGFIIYIPEGENNDVTRKPEFYDETYAYLRSVGIPLLSPENGT